MTPRDTALAAFTSVVWGLAFIATRFALDGFTAPQLTALRFLFAALPIFFVTRPAVSWRLLLLIGAVLYARPYRVTLAHSRLPIEVMRSGWAVSQVQALQHAPTISS